MKKAAVCFYGFLGVFLAHFLTGAVKAQIIPDATLSGESSIVISDPINGSQNETVIGGARRGGNLFHSFEGFTIPSGQSVYFVDPEGVTRIFSRVTGNSVSEIQGTLGVLGCSDLFFISNNGGPFKTR